ncbi:MAG: hypothetical protein JNL83_11300 [Myxococcales bacterium]|nr:hypothetical protein [Myxococcales bacterium]
MPIKGDEVLAVLGKSVRSRELKQLATACGEKPERDEFWLTFSRNHFCLGIDDDTITEVTFPDSYDGTFGVLPFGLTGGSRAEALKKLGAPAASPKVNSTMFEVPNDIFDLPDYTVWISFSPDAKQTSSILVRTAAACADERRERAAAGPPRAAPKQKKTASGAFLDALIAKIESGKKRKRPKAGVSKLLERALPDDLRRLLEAHAHYDHGRIDVGDYKIDDDITDDIVPHGRGTRTDRLVIGRTAGGDLWVVDWVPKTKVTAVRLALHEEDWREQKHAKSLDEHLALCAKTAAPDQIDIELP